MHALLTPDDGFSLEKAMQFIKGGFSFRLQSHGPCGKPVLRIIGFAIPKISWGTGPICE
jgi:hypothetical protein